MVAVIIPVLYPTAIAVNGFTVHALPTPYMFSVAFISLRETFETSLVVGIILAALGAMGQQRFRPWVWAGVGVGMLCSVALATAFHIYAASLHDEAKELYEGIVMLTAAGFVTWMVVWMHRNASSLKKNIHSRVESSAVAGSAVGIFFLTFTTTIREGAEMVIFLHATMLASGSNAHDIAGILLGIVAAILIAVLLFKGLTKLNVRLVMRISSVLLFILAISMAVHGAEELMEAFGL